MKKESIIYYIRLGVLTFWGVLLFGGIFWASAYILQYGVSTAKVEIQEFILSTDSQKSILFLLIFSLRGLFFIPSTLLVVLAGAIFSPFEAFVLSIIGQIISAVLLYVVAQFVGRKFILAHENDFFRRIDEVLSKKGFFSTLVLTIIPVIPADSVIIVAAITGIPFADFLLGFTLGSIGSFVPFLLLGKSFTHSQTFLWTLLPLLFLFLITIWAWKHPCFRDIFSKKKKKKYSKQK